MEDLTPDAVISIHDSIIAREGGDGRILSEGNLHQLVFHANLEGDAFRRAAIAFCFLCAYPVFRAGNRRTAVRIAETVLAGAGVPAGLPCEEMRRLAREIDAFAIGPGEVEDFLRGFTGSTC